MVLAAPALADVGHDHGEDSSESTPNASTADVARGKELFSSAGCASCHGPNAEGGAIGPALPGHSPDAVRRQVRTPVGAMPAFSKTQLPDADLEKIVAFISSLEAEGAGHGHEYELTAPVHHHLVMALNSLKAENERDALHHIDHALLVAKGEEREAVEKIRADAAAGRLHDAEHALTGAVAKLPGSDWSAVRLHADLALFALDRDNATDAEHHVGHALEAASAAERAALEEAKEHLEKGETREARGELEKLAGAAPSPVASPTVVKPSTRTPGFEATAALAALGVALLVLRRRGR